MNSGGVQDRRRIAELDLIARRARSQLVLLNWDYSVALAEWDTGSELFQKLGLSRGSSRLPVEIEKSVRTIVGGILKDPSLPGFLIHDSLVLRVSILESDATAMVVLFVEPERSREDLSSAAKRYNLTQREIEVLGLILQGLSAREIAAVLCISETTVSEHFKQLLLRTAARNRSDMVARILNWTDRLELPTNTEK